MEVNAWSEQSLPDPPASVCYDVTSQGLVCLGFCFWSLALLAVDKRDIAGFWSKAEELLFFFYYIRCSFLGNTTTNCTCGRSHLPFSSIWCKEQATWAEKDQSTSCFCHVFLWNNNPTLIEGGLDGLLSESLTWAHLAHPEWSFC